MSGVSLPVTRPIGRALIIGSASCRSGPLLIAQQVGFQCGESDNPYAAMAELCQRPLVYRAVIISLSSVYREELALIAAVKRRFAHLEIWVAHTDGRAAALAEASRLGADGLIAEDGLHRFAVTAPGVEPVTRVAPELKVPEPPPPQPPVVDEPKPARMRPAPEPEPLPGEPVLTAEELRALLSDPPAHAAEE